MDSLAYLAITGDVKMVNMAKAKHKHWEGGQHIIAKVKIPKVMKLLFPIR